MTILYSFKKDNEDTNTLNNRIESIEKMLENKEEYKEFPIKEFIEKYIRNDNNAALKEVIKALVKLNYSFDDVYNGLNLLSEKFDESNLSPYYIITSIETIREQKFKNDVNSYFVLGNMGVGKSTFINYLINNVIPHEVKFLDCWNFKQKRLKYLIKEKKFISPKIGKKLFNAQTIIPSKFPIKFDDNNKLSYIYDTPGFHITDSYEQEIASSLALEKALNS